MHPAADCELCHLAARRNLVVVPEGNPASLLWFIGEAPGVTEDLEGRPFVGAAGQLFDQYLAQCGIDRRQTYIFNSVLCKPLQTSPDAEEIAHCRRWIGEELEWAQKHVSATGRRVVVVMGRTAMGLGYPGLSVSKAAGKVRSCGNYLMLATYHPAATLPGRSPELAERVMMDFRLAAVLSGQDGGVIHG